MGQEKDATPETEDHGKYVTALPSHQTTTTRRQCSEVNPEDSKIHRISHTNVEQETVARHRTVPYVCSAGHTNQTAHTVNNEHASVVDSTVENYEDVNIEDVEMGVVTKMSCGAQDVGSKERDALIFTSTDTTEINSEEAQNKEGNKIQPDDDEEALDGGWGYFVIFGGFIIMVSGCHGGSNYIPYVHPKANAMTTNTKDQRNSLDFGVVIMVHLSVYSFLELYFCKVNRKFTTSHVITVTSDGTRVISQIVLHIVKILCFYST